MKKKSYFFILAFLFLFKTMYTQEYCFVNNGLKFQETVSFEVKGNIVKFGVWEHWNYQTNSSAESYLFYGKKTGNKITITFINIIPYTIPNKAKQSIWVLENGILKIPMLEKNHTSKKSEKTIVQFSICEVKVEER